MDLVRNKIPETIMHLSKKKVKLLSPKQACIGAHAMGAMQHARLDFRRRWEQAIESTGSSSISQIQRQGGDVAVPNAECLVGRPESPVLTHSSARIGSFI